MYVVFERNKVDVLVKMSLFQLGGWGFTENHLVTNYTCHFWLRKEPMKCRCCGWVGLSVRLHYALKLF